MADNIFPASAAKSARVPVTLTPSGIAAGCEVFIGPDQNTKTATSGVISFTSTGVAQNVQCPITMPAASANYKTFINITAGGAIIAAFQDVNNVVIPNVNVGNITWT